MSAMLELSWHGKAGDDKSGTMQLVFDGDLISVHLEKFTDFLTIERAMQSAANGARARALRDAMGTSRNAINDLLIAI